MRCLYILAVVLFPVFASAQFIFINTDGLPADTLLFIYLHY